MLIPSWRHKPEDLELWQEMEQADIVHGKSNSLARKIEQSKEAIRSIAGKCHVTISGGKDSACVIGLIDECGLLNKIPAFWMRAVPKYNPDIPEAFDRLKARFPALQLTVVDYDSPVPFNSPRELTEKESAKNFKSACASIQRQNGLRIIGVRADESGVRKMSVRHLGLITQNSCRPLGWWNLADVYGYAAAREIPLHPAYAMSGGGRWERKSLRIDALFGSDGEQFGRAEWEREYYGDILRRLEKSCNTPTDPA